jgi:putative transcriptional regulator
MKKDITFNAADLLRAVKETRDHFRGKKKLTMRVTHVALPEPAPQLGPQEVLSIRQRLNVSQPIFARMLNVPEITAVSWEKGRRHPSGAALRLLQLARRHPEVLQHA